MLVVTALLLPWKFLVIAIVDQMSSLQSGRAFYMRRTGPQALVVYEEDEEGVLRGDQGVRRTSFL